MNELVSLLQEILDYNEGKGKYNFSSLSNYDRENESFDSWMRIKEKIKETINKEKKHG